MPRPGRKEGKPPRKRHVIEAVLLGERESSEEYPTEDYGKREKPKTLQKPKKASSVSRPKIVRFRSSEEFEVTGSAKKRRLLDTAPTTEETARDSKHDGSFRGGKQPKRKCSDTYEDADLYKQPEPNAAESALEETDHKPTDLLLDVQVSDVQPGLKESPGALTISPQSVDLVVSSPSPETSEDVESL